MTAKIKTIGQSKHTRRKHKPKSVSKRDFDKVYWPYLPVLLVLVFLFSISAQSGMISAMLRHPVGGVLEYATSMSINDLLASTNAERVDAGVTGLSLNSRLNAAAQAKADDMATRNYWSHNTPEGEEPWIFATNQGYDYQKLGENLAAGFSDSQSTVNGWMGSPGHRANMLDTAFTQVGFGFANNPDYTSAGGGPMTIVVAFYGKPSVLAANTAPAQTQTQIKKPASEPRQVAEEKQEQEEETVPEPEIAAPAPVNTDTRTEESVAAATIKTSRANVALVDIFNSAAINQLFGLLLFGAAAVWASRHMISIRRVVVRGETFAIRHPLLDLGLLTIVALSFLLTQTIGLIK